MGNDNNDDIKKPRPGQKKVVIIGKSGVGKSCLLHQMIMGAFLTNSHPTIGAEFGFLKRPAQSGKGHDSLIIWDTGGSGKFIDIVRPYYAFTNIAILVYDICDEDSLTYLKTEYDKLCKTNGNNKVPCILVGMKRDTAAQHQQVAREQAEISAIEINSGKPPPVIECSALTGCNIDSVKTEIWKLANSTPAPETTPAARAQKAAARALPVAQEPARMNKQQRKAHIKSVYSDYINNGAYRITGSFRFYRYGIFGSEFYSASKILKMLEDREKLNPNGASHKTLTNHKDTLQKIATEEAKERTTPSTSNSR